MDISAWQQFITTVGVPVATLFVILWFARPIVLLMVQESIASSKSHAQFQAETVKHSAVTMEVLTELRRLQLDLSRKVDAVVTREWSEDLADKIKNPKMH